MAMAIWLATVAMAIGQLLTSSVATLATGQPDGQTPVANRWPRWPKRPP